MSNEQEDFTRSEESTETTENTEETTEESQEGAVDWEKKAKTLEAQKEHWRKKAEGVKDAPKEEPQEAPTGDLSQSDLYAIVKADVSEEDINTVKEFATLKKISVSDALKNSTLKTILREEQEIRSSANAANTGTAKRSNTEVSGDALIENARKGKLPESDADIMRLVRARKGLK